MKLQAGENGLRIHAQASPFSDSASALSPYWGLASSFFRTNSDPTSVDRLRAQLVEGSHVASHVFKAASEALAQEAKWLAKGGEPGEVITAIGFLHTPRDWVRDVLSAPDLTRDTILRARRVAPEALSLGLATKFTALQAEGNYLVPVVSKRTRVGLEEERSKGSDLRQSGLLEPFVLGGRWAPAPENLFGRIPVSPAAAAWYKSGWSNNPLQFDGEVDGTTVSGSVIVTLSAPTLSAGVATYFVEAEVVFDPTSVVIRGVTEEIQKIEHEILNPSDWDPLLRAQLVADLAAELARCQAGMEASVARLALELENPAVAVNFLRERLGLRSDSHPDELEAYWRVTRSRAWGRVPLTERIPYLGKSVRAEARRIVRDREMGDRVWKGFVGPALPLPFPVRDSKGSSDPAKRFRAKRRRAALKQATALLPASTQSILQRRWKGESSADIALSLGLTRQAVNKTLRKATQLLRSRLSVPQPPATLT